MLSSFSKLLVVADRTATERGLTALLLRLADDSIELRALRELLLLIHRQRLAAEAGSAAACATALSLLELDLCRFEETLHLHDQDQACAQANPQSCPIPRKRRRHGLHDRGLHDHHSRTQTELKA